MNVIRVCVFSTAIAVFASACSFGGQNIPGVDIIIKKTCPPKGCPNKVALGEGGLSSIRADFFGPGSLPFEGLIAVDFDGLLPGGGLPAGGTNFVLGSDGAQLFEFRLQSPDGEFFLPLIAAIPEPTGLGLVGLGVLLAGDLSRRRR